MSAAASSQPILDLAAVLALAARGWRVFPCRQREKTPLLHDWPHLATTDPAVIRAWHAEHPACNWGLASGAGSGFWALDVDGPKGEVSLKALIKNYGNLPARLTVRTGNGFHLYFSWPGDTELRNSAGKVGEGLDVRGEGGYVLAPGSVHPSGAIYVVVKEGPLPAAPDWLVRMAASTVPHISAAGDNGHIPSGKGEPAKLRLALQLIRAGQPRDVVVAAVLALDGKCEHQLGEAEVRRKVDDWATRYGRPGSLAELAEFELVTLGSLLAKGDTPAEYVWGDHLVVGTVSAVCAKPKVGKSTFARNLCLAVARGEDFLELPTRQGECVYLALEERENEVRADFAALGANGSEPILIHAAPSPAEGVLALVELVRERKPRLVVIDPLFRLARVRDESAYAETYAALGPLIDVARETGTHLMLLHHSGKSMKADAIDAPLGSTAISGAVCTLIVLRRTESYRTIETRQRVGNDMPETVLQHDSATHRLSLGAAKSDADRQSCEARIFEYLREASEPQTQAQIRDAVEGQTRVIRAALTGLAGAGKVVKSGEGTKGKPFLYEFPNSGSHYIAGTSKPESEKVTQPRMNTGGILVPDHSENSILVPELIEGGERERGDL
jgi:hypothetical protein